MRKKRAAAAAKAAGVDGMLIAHLPDVRYLCGFTGSNAVLALVGGRSVLFTDGRYTVQARAEAPGTKVVIAKKPAVVAACEWLEATEVRRCGFDAAHTTVAALETMRKALSAKVRRGMFVAAGPVVARMREVKDADEVKLIRTAALVGCDLFEGMLTYLEAGLTEVEVAATLEYAARLAGAEGMSFDTIVASGERSALPHGRATGARLPKQGFVTLDFGVILDGYCSDMTRTVHIGKALRDERDVYDSVLEAQEAAVAAVAPGVTAGEVDEAARSVLRRVKLDKYFSHSTGHGVGLEIHEGPRLAARQTQVLEQGMVITIEPGVYMPGRFGLRIEDMVLVTANGGEVLTPSVKAWIEL
ncbi:M24 family metallopeptidase [Tunturibacter empetritectus]|uniref:M24 family metallopeptidase n=1 Tax=Tunturiibacter empetritectus TaxID=3069691 RepID=UPI00288916FA|nr:Xaa-Pro peptidase family protein [Edaphobacter lichenicola]